MTKILVLYYSMYGHTETMAKAVAEGARSVEDTEVTLKRVPEIIPEEKARDAGLNSINRRQLPQQTNWLIMMPLYSGHLHALAICARRCVTFLTKLADFGLTES